MTFRSVYSDTILVKIYHSLLVGITAVYLFFKTMVVICSLKLIEYASLPMKLVHSLPIFQ